MVLKYKDKEILTLEDIQRLTVKDLRNILKSNSENAGGMKADLVLKVYALLMRDVVVRSVENTQQTAENCGENSGHFKYDETMRRISVLGWSTDIRQLPELNFIQLYDYLVVSTRKYRHILLKGTHYKKLKSYQFFFEGNVKQLESKVFQGQTYVKASVVPSMKKNLYRVVVELSPQSDILRAACTCPLDLVYPEKVNVTTLEECCLRLKILREGDYKGMPSLRHAHRGCLCGLYPATKALQLNLSTKC